MRLKRIFLPASGKDLSVVHNRRILLGAILSIALLLRVYMSFFTSLPHMHRDSIDYFAQADALISGGYINYFPNGYPFIIAGFKIFAGIYSDTWLLILNICLSTTTVFLVFKISLKVFRNVSIALLAAGILAVLPTQINYVRWLTSEVPSEFFLVAGYYCYTSQKPWLGGILFGLAIAIRTEFIPILLLLLLAEVIWQKRFSFKLSMGALIPVLILGWYCYGKTGEWSIAGHGKVNVMYSVTASGDNVDWYFNDKHPEIKTTGQAIDMYMDTMRAYPGKFIKDRVTNLYNLWSFYPGSSDESRSQVSRLVMGAGNLFMIVFGFLGWWYNRRNYYSFILIFPFIIVTGVHVFFLAISRYTYPVEPFMIILGSWTLMRVLWKMFLKKKAGLDGAKD